MDDSPDQIGQQLADLAELKEATQLRHGLRPGSPEWEEAVTVEEGLIDRIRRWIRPRRGDLADS